LNQATLEATLKPLRGNEENRDELTGDELKRFGQYEPDISLDFNSNSEEINKWIEQNQRKIGKIEDELKQGAKNSKR